MTNVSVKNTINVPADEVWKTLSSFRDVEKYIPLVKISTVEGSGVGAKRTCIIPNESGERKKSKRNSKVLIMMLKHLVIPLQTLHYHLRIILVQ